MKSITLLVEKAGPYDIPIRPEMVDRVVDRALRLCQEQGLHPLLAACAVIHEDCSAHQVHMSMEQADMFAIAVAKYLLALPSTTLEVEDTQAVA